MRTPKEDVRKLIEKLPDDASWDDILYMLYVRQKIEKGLADADAGRVVSQENIEKMFSQD